MTRVSISRDPFSRTEVVRRKAPSGCECRECGQVARFEYGSESDNFRQGWDGKYFCSIGCRRSYFGQ